MVLLAVDKKWRLRLEVLKLWRRGVSDAVKIMLHRLVYGYGLQGDVPIHFRLHTCLSSV
jgi:hypothetical protein